MADVANAADKAPRTVKHVGVAERDAVLRVQPLAKGGKEISSQWIEHERPVGVPVEDRLARPHARLNLDAVVEESPVEELRDHWSNSRTREIVTKEDLRRDHATDLRP